MTTGTRYRVEDGRSHIDIKVAHSRQLFDTRDPHRFANATSTRMPSSIFSLRQKRFPGHNGWRSP